MKSITRLQPRLENARKLAAEGAVRIEVKGNPVLAWVRSRELEHRVTIDGESGRCSCTWFARHGESRGPCKHVLAVRIVLGGGDDID
jgi:hypothetical protein